jgi:hypothetical protein
MSPNVSFSTDREINHAMALWGGDCRSRVVTGGATRCGFRGLICLPHSCRSRPAATGSGPELAACRRRPGRRLPCSSLATGTFGGRLLYVMFNSQWGIEVMLQKFQAEVKQTPAVTVLHTLNCPDCNGTDVPARIVRGRNVSEATLELIATYMSNDVRREVRACRCTKVPPKPPSGFWSRLRSA